MQELNDILQFIIQRDFKRIASFSRGPKDLWFVKTNHGINKSIFLFLEYKPLAKAYSVHVGITDGLAQTCLAEISSSVYQFLNPLMRSSFIIERPCWCFFDAGRALGWRAGYVVPDPTERHSYRFLMHQLFDDFVHPIFSSIKSSRSLVELLTRNDAPFEWAYTPSVLRASEIVALCTSLDMDPTEICETLRPFATYIARQISENFTIPVFVDQIALETRKSNSFRNREGPTRSLTSSG